jgi:hypothetical protein
VDGGIGYGFACRVLHTTGEVEWRFGECERGAAEAADEQGREKQEV